jgi:MFS superfamily sulfate permease-like transporter
MITVVAYSLIEEAPHDVIFFYRIRGWNELFLMCLIALTTFFWNLRVGIAVGIGLSLLRLLRHATRPRIQILGRVPGTKEFENAEFMPESVEFVPHCLIVKIPEPLTFANTGSLKDRLRRLEEHGTARAHPALPKVRNDVHNQNIIFDIHGVTGMDPAAAQVLLEIVQAYVDRGTKVWFCRVPRSKGSEVWRLLRVAGIVGLCGGEEHFLRSVDEALQATEKEGSLINFGDEEAMVGEGTQTAGEAGVRLRRRDGDGGAVEQDPIAAPTGRLADGPPAGGGGPSR